MERCVHCGEGLAEETRDHVFPASWYPLTTPSEVERWTVPSCRKCNCTLGKKEKELFIRLAMCVDPRKAEAAGLSAKAMRSMGIGAEGLSVKERWHRRALKLKVMASMWRYEPGTPTFPGFGLHRGFPTDEQIAINIPSNLLQEVAKKIVRGCEYRLASRVIEEPYVVKVYFVHSENVPELVVRAFQTAGAQTTQLGPGFRVTRVTAHDEPNSAIYKIIIWKTLVIYASILPDRED